MEDVGARNGVVIEDPQLLNDLLQSDTWELCDIPEQENPPSLTFANKFYEVQKYSSIDEHVHNFLV